MEIHHIGYLVKNILVSIEEFKKLGYEKKSNIIKDEIRYVDICFMEKDSYVIELVSPYDTKSIVYNLIKKFKNMPYHICYKTKCLEQDVVQLCNSGYIVINDLCVAPALDNKKVIFLLGKSTGMLELIEE